MKFEIGNLAIRVGKETPRTNELGATGTSVFAGLLYENEYNADLQGDRGIKIYDKMRRSDGQVKAGLLACKLPLQVARWDIAPASESEQDVEIADAVKEDLFENMTITWDDFLRHMLIMLDFGHMAFEKVWELRDGRWTWRKFAPRLPQSLIEWHVKPDGGLDYIVQQAWIDNSFKQVPLPVDKLLVFSHEREGSNYMGMSLLRAAYKHWYYKNNLYAIDGIAAERHGVGLATFTYPDQATQAQKDKVKEVGERLHAHERGYVATPEAIKFKLQGVEGQLHDIKGSIEHHDLQIVRSILAQFMNLGAKTTGSYALSQDQSQFFLMALQSVGRNICDTINRHAIRQMVDYNWGVKKYPKLTVSGLDNPDVLAYAQAISQLVTATAIVPDLELENELRRMLKLPLKKAGQGEPPVRVPVADRQPAEEKPREWPVHGKDAAGRIAYSPDQPRDEGGKWEETGAGEGGPKTKDGQPVKSVTKGKTTVNYKGKLSDNARHRVESSLDRLPQATRDSIQSVDVYDGAGPKGTFDHGEFSVGGRCLSNEMTGESRIELYGGGKYGSAGGQEYVDDMIGHEAGHAAWARPTSETGIPVEDYRAFHTATKSEGCLTAYAQKHYDSNSARGSIENFAEWHGMFHADRADDMAYMKETKPESYKAFNTLWTGFGGKSR